MVCVWIADLQCDAASVDGVVFGESVGKIKELMK